MADSSDVDQAWEGELVLGGGWAYYHGIAGDTSVHCHYPVQLIFAPSQPATVLLQDDVVLQGNHITIPSNVEHQMEKMDQVVDMVYVEPALMHEQINAPETMDEWLARLKKARPISEDRRIGQAIELVENSLDQKISLSQIAKAAGMSKSLFTDQFRLATGIPLRRYVLWRRLNLAVKAIGEGESATQAAHRAGFSDSAHFSRTMRETFGVSPSGSVQRLKISTLVPL
jgi:AraC-like DNA-binding protein